MDTVPGHNGHFEVEHGATHLTGSRNMAAYLTGSRSTVAPTLDRSLGGPRGWSSCSYREGNTGGFTAWFAVRE